MTRFAGKRARSSKMTLKAQRLSTQARRFRSSRQLSCLAGRAAWPRGLLGYSDTSHPHSIFRRIDMALVKHSVRTVRNACRSCGRSNLYWAHDTEKLYHKACERCDVTGAFVLIEQDGSRQDCRGTTDHAGDSASGRKLSRL